MKYVTDEQYKTAELNGISKKNVYQRVYMYGWEIERAVTDPIKKMKSPWKDFKQIALSNDISCETFLNRVNKQGMTPREAATRPPMTRSEINRLAVAGRKVLLNKYMIAEAEQNGINRHSLYNRIYRLGWTIEDATTLPIGTILRYHKQREEIKEYWEEKGENKMKRRRAELENATI